LNCQCIDAISGLQCQDMKHINISYNTWYFLNYSESNMCYKNKTHVVGM